MRKSTAVVWEGDFRISSQNGRRPVRARARARAIVLIRFTTSLLLCGSAPAALALALPPRIAEYAFLRHRLSVPPSFSLSPSTKIEDRRRKIDHAKRDCVKTDRHHPSASASATGRKKAGRREEKRGKARESETKGAGRRGEARRGRRGLLQPKERENERTNERSIDRSRNVGDGCKSDGLLLPMYARPRFSPPQPLHECSSMYMYVARMA